MAGPRIDDRIRRFIAGSPEHAAEVTRRAGEMAWELGVPRPSYQQVRVLLNASRARSATHPVRRADAGGRGGHRGAQPTRRARRPAVQHTGRRVLELVLQMGGLPRPARSQVRPAPRRPALPRTRHDVLDLLGHLWDYPAPGLADFYERYKHGRL